MLRRPLLLALVVCWPSFSYSEGIKPYYGTTGNAAESGLSWNMDSVLPTPPGLDIQGVIYSYRIRKEDGSYVTVHIQNKRSDNLGYIFRESDEWKPGSQDGTEINRVVPTIPGIPRAAWGDGSIEVQGEGRVESPSVIYQYRVDPCYDPQTSPACPGYELQLPDIYSPDYTIYDALAEGHDKIDQAKDYYEESEGESEEEREARESEEKRDSRERLEKALAAADNTALFAQALAASQQLAAVGARIEPYYSIEIPGGTYSETIALRDAQLPDSRAGLRNGLAQQLLHKQMVDAQYKGD